MRLSRHRERELRKLAPEGEKVSESVLAKATIAVNTILRRKGSISAYELHTARSQDTGENLQLKDEDIYNDQNKLRKSKEKYLHHQILKLEIRSRQYRPKTNIK